MNAQATITKAMIDQQQRILDAIIEHGVERTAIEMLASIAVDALRRAGFVIKKGGR